MANSPLEKESDPYNYGNKLNFWLRSLLLLFISAIQMKTYSDHGCREGIMLSPVYHEPVQTIVIKNTVVYWSNWRKVAFLKEKTGPIDMWGMPVSHWPLYILCITKISWNLPMRGAGFWHKDREVKRMWHFDNFIFISGFLSQRMWHWWSRTMLPDCGAMSRR